MLTTHLCQTDRCMSDITLCLMSIWGNQNRNAINNAHTFRYVVHFLHPLCYTIRNKLTQTCKARTPSRFGVGAETKCADQAHGVALRNRLFTNLILCLTVLTGVCFARCKAVWFNFQCEEMIHRMKKSMSCGWWCFCCFPGSLLDVLIYSIYSTRCLGACFGLNIVRVREVIECDNEFSWMNSLQPTSIYDCQSCLKPLFFFLSDNKES